MARDALDPGTDGTFPAWPRKPDGSPDPERMPEGVQMHKGVRVDVTPRHPDGTPIVPPTIPPSGGGS